MIHQIYSVQNKVEDRDSVNCSRDHYHDCSLKIHVGCESLSTYTGFLLWRRGGAHMHPCMDA